MSSEISGEYLVPAPPQRVWDALNDPRVLQASIAGCQSLEKLSDTEFAAVVTSRVGPISATFRGSVALSDIVPLQGYTLTGRGQGGAAGFARMTSRVQLEPRDGNTLLRYSAQAEVGGKLASVGSRLVQSVARKSADDFFAAFVRQLGGEVAVPAPAATALERQAPLGVQVPAPAPAGGGLGAPVPAWIALLTAGLGLALGYCLALLAR